MELEVGLVAIGVGIAIGMSGLGSGIGVGIAGAAGTGVIAENPKKFGTALVFQALPQTQAIYGLLVGLLLLAGSGLLGVGGKEISMATGIAAIGAGLSVGLAGISAIGQGITAAGGIGAAAYDPTTFGKSMVLSVMSETFAIFGLLGAILIMFGVGLF